MLACVYRWRLADVRETKTRRGGLSPIVVCLFQRRGQTMEQNGSELPFLYTRLQYRRVSACSWMKDEHVSLTATPQRARVDWRLYRAAGNVVNISEKPLGTAQNICGIFFAILPLLLCELSRHI